MITKRHVSNVKEILIILFLFVWLHYSANAQSESEALQEPQFILEEIIVIGNRSESLLKKSTTPSGVMTGLELSTLPLNNLVDAISYLPGITFVNQDASGYMPMAIVRSFHGGYEQYDGFCLETQHFPNAPNQTKILSTILILGEKYNHLTVHRFFTFMSFSK